MQDLIEGTYATGQNAFHPHSAESSNETGVLDETSDDHERFDKHQEIDPALLDQSVSFLYLKCF